MDWYYSQDGQTVGPVNDDQFSALVRTGVITPGTSVWREGMPDWQDYREIAPEEPPTPVPNREEADPETKAISFDTSDLEKALAKAALAAKAPISAPTPTVKSELDQVSLELEKALEKAAAAAHRQAQAPAPAVLDLDGPGSEKEKRSPDEKPVGLGRPPEPFEKKEKVPLDPVPSPDVPADLPKKRSQMSGWTPRYAGLGPRSAAKAVDLFIYAAIFFLVLIPLTGDFFTSSTLAPGQGLTRIEVGLLFVLGLHFGFQTFFLGKYGDTPGKMIFRLKVARVDGSRLTYSQAFKRALGEILTWMTLGIGYSMAVKDDEKRAFHDRLCNTRVVKAS